ARKTEIEPFRYLLETTARPILPVGRQPNDGGAQAPRGPSDRPQRPRPVAPFVRGGDPVHARAKPRSSPLHAVGAAIPGGKTARKTAPFRFDAGAAGPRQGTQRAVHARHAERQSSAGRLELNAHRLLRWTWRRCGR